MLELAMMFMIGAVPQLDWNTMQKHVDNGGHAIALISGAETDPLFQRVNIFLVDGEKKTYMTSFQWAFRDGPKDMNVVVGLTLHMKKHVVGPNAKFVLEGEPIKGKFPVKVKFKKIELQIEK